MDRATFVQQGFAPFDPHTRRTGALVKGPGRQFRVAKGAVNAVAQVCRLDEQASRYPEGRADEYARKGYRALAVARSNEQDELEIVGLVTLYDKPRSAPTGACAIVGPAQGAATVCYVFPPHPAIRTSLRQHPHDFFTHGPYNRG